MTVESFLDGRIELRCGDSRDVLKTIPDCSIDSIVTDPPYALVSIVKRFGKAGSAAVKVPEDGSGAYARASAGFMGKAWDTGETAFAVDFWAECLRVLKPGGHVVAFSGTRTYHRMACAIEDAGFEVRDMLQYLYGSGFPKSHNVTKGLGDNACCCEATSERDLRPLRSSDVSAPIYIEDQRGQVLLAVVPEQGTHGSMFCKDAEEGQPRSEEPGLEGRGDIPQAPRQLCERPLCAMPAGIDIDGPDGWLRDGAPAGNGSVGGATVDADRVRSPSGSQAAEQSSIEPGDVAGQPQPQTSGAWEDCGRCGKPMVPAGWGTALKPACEPICFGRKPLCGTVAANVVEYGTGAINIDGCRIHGEDALGGEYTVKRLKPGATLAKSGGNWRPEDGGIEFHGNMKPGRWPANVLHDGSDEVITAFPESDSGSGSGSGSGGIWSPSTGEPAGPTYGDGNGSAARFFYTAKADAMDRIGSKHPTVKPVDLMQWLCRLVTPPGGTVLDPFSGTGTTGEAAFREGFKAVLIEREEEYQADIRRRMALCLAGPEERKRESIKAKLGDVPFEAGSLFAPLDTPPPLNGGNTTDTTASSSSDLRSHDRADRNEEVAT